MTLKMDKQTADALTLGIAEGLSQVGELTFGVYAGDFHWCDEVMGAMPDGIAHRIRKICGDDGLADFLTAEVSYMLENLPDYSVEDYDKLTDVPLFTDTIAASKLLVDGLRKLPLPYRLTAPLPGSFSHRFSSLIQEFELGPGISITLGSKLEGDYPVSSGYHNRDIAILRDFGRDKNVVLDSSQFYLVQLRSGFVGRQKEPPIFEEFKASLRQALGGMLALDLIKQENSFVVKTSDGAYIAHKLQDPTELVLGERMTATLRLFFAQMGAPGSGFRIEKDPRSDSEMIDSLMKLKSLFLPNDQGQRLSVAAIWFLRAHLSRDTLDSLLESTIALEALLGGGNAEGNKLAALLGNRCAYLIGESYTERQSILEEFQQIYALRSRIVHEGHHSLTRPERVLIGAARKLCQRALVREMSLTASG